MPRFGKEIISLINQGSVPGGTGVNRSAIESAVDWGATDESSRILLCDAQTSGGLLLCVAPRQLDAVLTFLRAKRTLCAAVIGKITRGKDAHIVVHP